jgi:hypothetical protein
MLLFGASDGEWCRGEGCFLAIQKKNVRDDDAVEQQCDETRKSSLASGATKVLLLEGFATNDSHGTAAMMSFFDLVRRKRLISKSSVPPSFPNWQRLFAACFFLESSTLRKLFFFV